MIAEHRNGSVIGKTVTDDRFPFVNVLSDLWSPSWRMISNDTFEVNM
jgi:hypothetical protein